MQRSDIKFKKGDKIMRVLEPKNDCTLCRLHTKWIVEDVSSDGKWVAVTSIDADPETIDIWSFYISFFKLVITCKAK